MSKNTVVIAISMCCLAGLASAADKGFDLGKREYLNSCGACHGADGKAQTQIIDILKVAAPDLSQLAKKNGGVFPLARVYETIDGRLSIKAHGSREMPIWGQRYSVEAAPAYDDYPHNAEAHVRARILGIVDYIYRLQGK
jgi:mono/diheme cytochrome c family protein